jgi:hypothetical protein
VVFALSLLAASSRAAASQSDADELEMPSVIRGTSSCPSPDAVWAELGTLVPRERLQARLRALTGNAARVEIDDLGVSSRVIVGGRAREYRDEMRDCAYRARIAAVFIALAIDPAEVRAAEPPPPPAVAPAPIAPPPPVPRASVRLDAGAALDAGLGPAVALAQAGTALRLVIGRGRVAGVAGIVALVPVDTDVGGVRVHQQRFPADLGVRVHLAQSRFEPYAELGIAAALLSVRGLDLVTSRATSALEIGARGALGMRLPLRGRLSLFGALHVEVVPSPPEIFALPRGAAGNTPLVWLGASAGASIGWL